MAKKGGRAEKQKEALLGPRKQGAGKTQHSDLGHSSQLVSASSNVKLSFRA
jgi:hypothetical protein